jgi:hypothetical protein
MTFRSRQIGPSSRILGQILPRWSSPSCDTTRAENPPRPIVRNISPIFIEEIRHLAVSAPYPSRPERGTFASIYSSPTEEGSSLRWRQPVPRTNRASTLAPPRPLERCLGETWCQSTAVPRSRAAVFQRLRQVSTSRAIYAVKRTSLNTLCYGSPHCLEQRVLGSPTETGIHECQPEIGQEPHPPPSTTIPIPRWLGSWVNLEHCWTLARHTRLVSSTSSQSGEELLVALDH